MNIRPLSVWATYRYRYVIAYALLAVAVLLLFSLYLDSIPAGLGPSEERSIVTSAALMFNKLPTDVVDLPYHALQKVSLDLFGITPLGVRLPSLIFGALTALCLALILRRWFKPHIALLATVVIVTSAWLLSMSRLGTPVIMVPFWTSLIILCATHISQQSRGWKSWKILLAFTAALSLYTPYMIYLFIAAFIAAMIQPHLRYLLRESGALTVTVGFLCFAALLIPLGWGVYQNPFVLRDLAAIPANLPDPIVFFGGLIDALSHVANPYNVSFGETLTPALGIVTVVLLIMGAVRLLSDFHSVRAYVLLIWAAILVPFVGLNPSAVAVLFVPAMLVSAIGLHLIISYWYRLFPRNPYARIFGLIPLAFLIFSIVQLNYQRYFYGMLYNEQAGTVFKEDVFLAHKQLQTVAPTAPVTLVVAAKDKPLYETMVATRPSAKVVTASEAARRKGTWIIASSQYTAVRKKIRGMPKTLLVTDRSANSLRFWVYQQE